MPFIPADKMKQLREAARNGDERAKKILQAQLNKQDYSADFDSYFSPNPAPETVQKEMSVSVQEPAKKTGTGNPKLDEWLRSNNISENDYEYKDAINEYYAEYPDQLPHELAREENADVEEQVDLTKDIAQKIIDLISGCDACMLSIMQNDDMSDASQKGAMAILQEIKQNALECADKIKKVKNSICKNEENIAQ